MTYSNARRNKSIGDFRHTKPSYNDKACITQLLSVKPRNEQTTTHLHNRRVLLASLYKLVKCQLCVLVTIHIAEDLVHALYRGWKCDVNRILAALPSLVCPRPRAA